MSSSRTGPPLRVAPSGLFSWLPLWSSPLLLFSLRVPLFLPAHRVTTSRSACLELRGHDSMFPPSRCAIRGNGKGGRWSTTQERSAALRSHALWQLLEILHIPKLGALP